MYAVAWGVGSGKLALPIPEASPPLLKDLLNGMPVFGLHLFGFLWLY